jgi:hypothetical protein
MDPGSALRLSGMTGKIAARSSRNNSHPQSIFRASSGSMIGMPSRIG